MGQILSLILEYYLKNQRHLDDVYLLNRLNSGNFVFRYKPNPYIVANEVILSKPGHFLLFDSAMEHFVTKNCSDGHRIVISMNFNIVES